MKAHASLLLACLSVQAMQGQASRTGPEWTTAGMDAQRSRSVPADPQITLETMKQPGFTFLWKQAFASKKTGPESLSEPVLVNTFIGYKGFKALAVLGANNALFAVDYDLGRTYWEKHFDVPAGLPSCPVGNSVAPGRLTPLVPPPITGNGLRGGYHSAVSRSGEGIPLKEVSRVPAGAPPPAPASTQAAAPANAPAPNGPGIGGASGPGGIPNAAPPNAGPITGPVRTGPPPGTGLYKGSQPIYAVSSDGVLHAVSQGSAKELQKPVAFVPAGSGLYSLIDVNDTIYAATVPGCGTAPDTVFAMDVSRAAGSPVSWKSTAGHILGATAFTRNGAVVIAAERALVVLQPKTLTVSRSITVPGRLLSAPVVWTHAGKEMIAVTAADGRVLVYAAAEGTNAITASERVAHATPTTLTTWADAAGTRWLLAADGLHQNSSMQAFRFVEQDGKLSLQAAWQSKPMDAPGAPIVINGVVFALATGQQRGTAVSGQVAPRSHPATLYALDAENGRELWNSGRQITSYVDSSALSFSPGQVYLGTADNTLYAFGFPVPRQ